jgi:hypothetical protein
MRCRLVDMYKAAGPFLPGPYVRGDYRRRAFPEFLNLSHKNS